MSQMLPSVKCSNCGLQIPMDQLGEHICAPAPPLPTLNSSKNSLNLPKPSFTPNAATSLLPQRLQGLVGGPPPPGSRGPPANPGPPRNDQLRLNTGGHLSTHLLLRIRRVPAALGRPACATRLLQGSLHVRWGVSGSRRPPVANLGRARSGSNASAGMSPTTARPFGREIPSSPVAPPPQPPPLVTQVGGEAGMAGVGRRGFAAAARAAMFSARNPSAPTPPPTKASPPRNIDVSPTIRSDSTPPLSTSSGSSNSPGVASYPESPVSPRSPATGAQSSTTVVDVYLVSRK
ncbi:hypothetical protein K438DRAFT_1226563 [Mycena galopus ATCC 62051]|nr:hypothetical protein K438DRAFT_1226563 [Mycena galopus ATCC 62051]